MIMLIILDVSMALHSENVQIIHRDRFVILTFLREI